MATHAPTSSLISRCSSLTPTPSKHAPVQPPQCDELVHIHLDQTRKGDHGDGNGDNDNKSTGDENTVAAAAIAFAAASTGGNTAAEEMHLVARLLSSSLLMPSVVIGIEVAAFCVARYL
mmetsp:Transcript_10158/g.18618  ORF Transcript_10158/g.18618 Transcript_10158/m.18618 type:complete len:119 (+) Transcript_10158:170-526(+)|eukprot:CAMPEP_0171854666 /NCGR_PEP_ID=MMETSP0992-20121227/23009_1 /TAXON_ID=483369 /ORGANISM="non described non described, Strain CCMP2098" /LENGTH=118 /DNA_ID=CAMNT_0012475313 /DNA_START=191 /DNA_END=547 /DNA_ORIENTATION=-